MGCWGVYNDEQQKLGVQIGAISYCRHHVLVCMVIPFTFKTPDLRSSLFYTPQHPVTTYASAPELSIRIGCSGVYNYKPQRLGVRNGAISYCRHHVLVYMVIPFTFKTPDLRSSSFYPSQHPIPAYASAPKISTGIGCWGVYNDEQQRLGVQNGAISYCQHHVLVCMVIPFTFKTPDLRSSSFYPTQQTHTILCVFS